MNLFLIEQGKNREEKGGGNQVIAMMKRGRNLKTGTWKTDGHRDFSFIGNGPFVMPGKIIYFCSMETTMTIPVTFTAGAISEIKRLMAEPGFDATQKLRVGVKGGGCSGMTYILGFDQPGERDMHFETDGIACIMDKTHEMYLFGMQVDWQNGLNNRGFAFKNPNASTTCGCGTSFAV